MEKHEYVEKFLTSQTITESNPHRESTLISLLNGARKLSGRKLETGEYCHGEINEANFENGTYFSFQFTGVLLYLILLEQLGYLFRPKGKSIASGDKNELYQVLMQFSDLGQDKSMAIKALRNSLSHKFSLATDNTKSKPEKFKFILSSSMNVEIVKLGYWEGDFNDRNESTLTTIYVSDLIDLAEKIYSDICFRWKLGEVDMLLFDKWDEFETRFTFRY